MLFLLNDAVISTRNVKLAEVLAPRMRALTFDAAGRLGQEMFAAQPLLHHADLERAERLAALLAAKALQVNAAQFAAPRAGCRPEEVRTCFASIEFEVMIDLYRRQRDGKLTQAWIDRALWSRLAA